MITKVLIANRGEIACRLIEGIQSAGYDTVAIASDADKDALFTVLADETVNLGGLTATDSYLNMDKVIAAAKKTGADAIHPGYGFLSENAAFASLCEQNGIIFIGPSPSAIETMGDKAAAKRLMISMEVPCIPGYEGEAQDNGSLIAAAKAIEYPLMVKAAAGGGGRGIRFVETAADLESAIESAQIEAQNAFGSKALILEKALINALHIEIQIAADSHGNIIHLCERDCSAQRRHQKVIEEAPSPYLSEAMREAMGTTAIDVARAVNYVGVGTVEFLVVPRVVAPRVVAPGAEEDTDTFYFLEMNTRLQVEHPVTELILGIDLVDWQLRIAEGEVLPLDQEDIQIDGHAMEVRIYAEDPADNFRPQTGKLAIFDPAEGEGIRIDLGVYSGSVISPHYDAMLAKLIAWGANREEARKRLIQAVKNTKVLGLTTNKSFLVQLLENESFKAGQIDTGFISDDLLENIDANPRSVDFTLVAALLQDNQHPMGSWSNVAPLVRTEKLRCKSQSYDVSVIKNKLGYVLKVNDEEIIIDSIQHFDGEVSYTIGGVTSIAAYYIEGSNIYLDLGDRVYEFERETYQVCTIEAISGGGVIKATTEGLVLAVKVKPGDSVLKGDNLVVIEAMKMEHRHVAEIDGLIASVNISVGQQIKNRQILVEITPEETEIESA